SQSSPPRAARPRAAPARDGAPQRGGTPGCGGAAAPRPRGSAAQYLAPRRGAAATTYWRRRVVVLGAGVGVLTTLSWAANSLLATGSAGRHPTAAGHTTAAR